eukprot:7741428-Alexandrium_andersonii.AAC.1
MSASLVGSEMCIRDRPRGRRCGLLADATRRSEPRRHHRPEQIRGERHGQDQNQEGHRKQEALLLTLLRSAVHDQAGVCRDDALLDPSEVRPGCFPLVARKQRWQPSAKRISGRSALGIR